MTNEEIQRTMEFILTQQAQFAANMQQLQEGQKELQQAQARTEQLVTHLTNVLREVVDEQARMSERHVASQVYTEERLAALRAHTDERFAELADSQAHTEQKLNALIDIVREGRNGKS